MAPTGIVNRKAKCTGITQELSVTRTIAFESHNSSLKELLFITSVFTDEETGIKRLKQFHPGHIRDERKTQGSSADSPILDSMLLITPGRR